MGDSEKRQIEEAVTPLLDESRDRIIGFVAPQGGIYDYTRDGQARWPNDGQARWPNDGQPKWPHDGQTRLVKKGQVLPVCRCGRGQWRLRK